jgi:hypothetical protein
MILFAPLDSIFAGVRIVTLTALAEAVRVGRQVLVRRAAVIALVSAAITAAWTVVILTLPREVGTSLLGPTWDVNQATLRGHRVASAARYVALPAQTGLRALNDTVAVGTAEAGARGAASGLAAAHCAGVRPVGTRHSPVRSRRGSPVGSTPLTDGPVAHGRARARSRYA